MTCTIKEKKKGGEGLRYRTWRILVDVNKRPDPRRVISENSWGLGIGMRLMTGSFVLRDIKKLNCSPFSCPDLNSGASLHNCWQI